MTLLLLGQLETFFINLTMKYTPKIGVGMFDLCLSEGVLAHWWHLLAFMKAMNLLHWVMNAVSYRRTAMAIKMTSKVDTFCIVGLFAVALVAAGAIRSEYLTEAKN